MNSPSEGAEEGSHTLLERAPYFFSGTMGRELDSVLASMMRLTEQLPESSSDAKQVAAQIQEHGERVRRVLRSLEHLRALHAEETEPEVVDALDLADELLADYEPPAREQGLVLSLEAPPSPVEMTTDAETLRRALGHLLANAIASTPADEVTLHVDPADTMVEFRLQPTGVSAPPDAFSSLFEASAQRGPEQEPRSEGLRVGLWLARAFARRLSGDLETESQPEASVLTLRVPPGRTDAESPRAGEGTEMAASGTTEDTELPRLLVLEDNETTQKLFDRMLQDEYRVDLSDEAQEAIQKAEANIYDAFVLDINLEGRYTGVEVLHAVRKMEEYSSAPVVACTAYSMQKHQKQFLHTGFDEVVTKPVTKRELVGTIGHELESPSASEFQVPEGSLSGIEVPPIPTTLIEISELVSSDSSQDTEALTEILERDQVVTQWLLRHINSAYYGIRTSIDTVGRAVSYLGFQRVCNLVLTKTVGNSFADSQQAAVKRVQRYIMKTSTLAAFIARELAERFDLDAPEMAYTGGMLAQIGRLALLGAEGEAYADLWYEHTDRPASFAGPPPQGQEMIQFEVDYVKKGCAVGKACKLSEDLRAILRGHQRPTKVADEFRPLVSTVSLALKVAHLAGDLEKEDPWGEKEKLTGELRDASATRYLSGQSSLSSKALRSEVVEIAEDAGEFVRDVLDGPA
jgi:two-component system aerobic respiration control sensor histidine kinase ArcB